MQNASRSIQEIDGMQKTTLSSLLVSAMGVRMRTSRDLGAQLTVQKDAVRREFKKIGMEHQWHGAAELLLTQWLP